MSQYSCRICESQHKNFSQISAVTEEHAKMLKELYPKFKPRQPPNSYSGFLCVPCSRKLTHAYDFQQKIKVSEERFWKNYSQNPKKKIKPESKEGKASKVKKEPGNYDMTVSLDPSSMMFDEDPLHHTIFAAPLNQPTYETVSEEQLSEILDRELAGLDTAEKQKVILHHLRKYVDQTDRRGVKTIVCKLCHDEFANQTNAYRHLKCKHFRNVFSEYSCQYCDFKSPRKDKVTRHVQNTHKDMQSNAWCPADLESPFKFSCETCFKKFRTAADLSLHNNGERCKNGIKLESIYAPVEPMQQTETIDLDEEPSTTLNDSIEIGEESFSH